MTDPSIWLALATILLATVFAGVVNYAAVSLDDSVDPWLRRAAAGSGLIGVGLLVLIPIFLVFTAATFGGLVDVVVLLLEGAAVSSCVSFALVVWAWVSTRSKA